MKRTVRKSKKKTQVDAYVHEGQTRKNNPPVGLVSSATDKLNGRTQYQHDPHIDPFLSWAGKAEGNSFEVQNVSLHIHERIDPQRVIKAFVQDKKKDERQISLFEQPENDPPLTQAVDFYHHEQGWANRLIAGDSLLVMNSLLHKEGMAGKVQMIYIDPPYGIKYNSNFQPFVNKRDVKDGNDADIPAEPEMIQAFRDTWELGIHSYLTYLRDRLLLCKELLNETGSVFIQINAENLHKAMEIMDEIMGEKNFCCLISFSKTTGFSGKYLSSVADYIVWYAKDAEKLKYYQLFREKLPGDEGATKYKPVHLILAAAKLNYDPERLATSDQLTSQGESVNTKQDFQYENRTWKPRPGLHWKTTIEGLQRLQKARRLLVEGDSLRYLRFLDDFPVFPIANVWTDIGGIQERSEGKIYVVQTANLALQRCLLMTTDPGDLVLDITCGSGTTAYVAEQWGRRWITCDTSRVAITLAKQRLMTAKYDYYELAHPEEGVRSGFKYKTVPHITLGSIANNEPPKQETLYDQPFKVSGKVRVTGPFTVEAVPSLRVKPFDGKAPKLDLTHEQLARSGETGRQAEWRDELKATGIRATGGKVLNFSRVEPMRATRFLHAEAETLEESGKNKLAYISFGPDYGPLEQRQVEEAMREARALGQKPDFVIFAAFHFDPEAAKDIDQIQVSGIQILKAQMSVDLLTQDLRKKRSSNQSYWLIGQPDVEVIKLKDKYKVKVKGFDYYNPVTGEIESKGTKQIAMWFLDTDYDERSLYPDQVFFPEGDPKRDWTRLAKALNGEVNEELLEKFSGVESIPFSAGENKKIAVKIIDNRGIESFVVKKLA